MLDACLDDETVAAVVAGTHPLAAESGAHVERCAACRELLAALVHGDGTASPTAGGVDARYPVVAEVSHSRHARVAIVRDPWIGREVVLKEPVASDRDPEARARLEARFEREARITARLAHPSIVPVHEIGRDADGTPYFTMSQVRGVTLAAALARCASPDARLGLIGHFADVCHAIAYAHSRGVIHRDLKPGNVMVGEFGETIVIDWGLAHVLRGADDRARDATLAPASELAPAATLDGELVGTPTYMSPEQARGGSVDERTDVWGLGAILYELLAGRPPFAGETIAEVIRAVANDRPRPLGDAAPPELIAVVERALARDPAARYATAGELAAEIDAFRNGRRVAAYTYSSWELVRAFVARHRAAVAAAGLAIVTVAVLSIAYQRSLVASRDRAQDAERVAETARAAAVVDRARSEASLALALTAQATAARQRGDGAAAYVLAASALVHGDGPIARGIVAALGDDVMPRLVWRTAADPAGAHGLAPILTVAVTPTGEVVSLDVDGRLRVRSLEDAHVVAQAELGAEVRRLAVSSEGHIAVAANDGLWTWSAADGARRIAEAVPADTAAFADPTHVALAGDDGHLAVFDAAGHEQAHIALGHLNYALAAATDGTLAAAGADGSIQLWNPRTGASRRLLGHRDAVLAVAFAADGKSLISGARDGAVLVWPVDGTAPPRRLAELGGMVIAIAVDPGGRWIAAAGADRSIHLWSAEGTPIATWPAHRDVIATLAFTAHGELLSSGYDATIAAWDLSQLDGERSAQLAAPATGLAAIGHELIAGTREGQLVRFDDHVHKVADRATTGAITAVAAARDVIVAAYADGAIRVVSPTFVPIRELHVRVGAGLEAMALDGSGAHIAWGGSTAFGVDATTLGTQRTSAIAFSPSGATIVRGGEAEISWHALTGEVRGTLTEGLQSIAGLAWQPDGARVAIAMTSPRVVIAEPSHAVATFVAPTGLDVCALGYSPSGAWLAGGAMNGAIVVWSSRGEVRAVLTGHHEQITSLAFTSDDALASTSTDGTLRIWKLAALAADPERLLRDVAARSGIVLEASEVVAR